MAKLNQSRGKLVRKFGENIFGNPKYDRLLNRKPYGPGQHAQSRRAKVSNYGIQLQEKQKIKFMYGLLEKQFRITFKKAEKLKGETGTNMLQLLETLQWILLLTRDKCKVFNYPSVTLTSVFFHHLGWNSEWSLT